jgi:hypothetical protein
MYYRIAIRREGGHQGQSPLWKWYSTTLGSLNAVLFFFQYYHSLPLERLRVFSASSREELKEQPLYENVGTGSHSVPAGQFLCELSSHVHVKKAEVLAHRTREQQEPATKSRVSHRFYTKTSTETHTLIEQGMSDLERRREETGYGSGSDHDLPYIFTLPESWPQVRAWMRLLSRVRTGELQP